MARVSCTCNDFVLFFAFTYSAVDILMEWDHYATCSRPVQLWLLLSYLCILMFRGLHYIGWMLSDDGEDFLIYHQRGPPRWVNFVILGVMYPFFTVWTIVGTVWIIDVIRHTGSCLPPGSHPWFLLIWLALCYVWVFIYSSFIGLSILLEYRAHIAQRELRSIETDDILRRWGRIQIFADYGISLMKRGLTPKQIEQLPITTIKCADNSTCSICLDDFKEGDKCRQLSCMHNFHVSCIDIWLLRHAECPNCKRAIMAPGQCV